MDRSKVNHKKTDKDKIFDDHEKRATDKRINNEYC